MTAPNSIVAAMEARQRPVEIFDCSAVLRGEGALGAIACREPTIAEEIRAKVWAARYLSDNAGAEIEVDEASNTTVETLGVIAEAFRDPADPHNIPAFVPAWLVDGRSPLLGEEVEGLIAMLEETRARHSKRPRAIDDETAEGLAFALSQCDEADAAELLLHMSRSDLIALSVALSRRLVPVEG